jgi:lipopolysaccharide/colanic/teichoic acid biosynthesis glycosyltransferase
MPMVRSRYLDAGSRVGERRLSWRWPIRAATVRLGSKYSIDRVAAVSGLLVTAPLIAATAFALRIAGQQPVLRRTELLGQGGRVVTVLGFAITGESRAWRAGPRPRTIDFPAPHARPGLTGLAQLEQLRRPISAGERLELDDEYARSWSLALDLRIVARTMWRVASSAL